MKSLIIIAHGSKKESSNNEVLEIVKSIKNSNTQYTLIEPAFLEFAKPSVEESVESCLQSKTTDIMVYPYFLNSGKHVTVDIPNLFSELKSKYPKINFSILPHFGQSNTITNIILSDIQCDKQ